MAFFAELLDETAAECPRLQALPVIRDAVAGRVTLAEYRRFLAEAYHHVKHTVPLLMACGSRLPERLEWLRGAVAEYIDEEYNQYATQLENVAKNKNNKEAATKLNELQQQVSAIGEPKKESDVVYEKIKSNAEQKQTEIAKAEAKSNEIKNEIIDINKEISVNEN